MYGATMSQPRVDLVLLFERVMWQYDLLSQAPAASVGNESSHSAPGSKAPPNPFSSATRLRFHFSRCQTDEARRRVIEEALEEIRSHRYSKKPPGLVKGTVEWKRSLRNDPAPPGIVAHTHGVDLATVYRWRKRDR